MACPLHATPVSLSCRVAVRGALNVPTRASVRFAPGRRNKVEYGFADAPEDQANAHAGAEKHGKPAPGGKFGPRIGTAQADIAVTAEK